LKKEKTSFSVGETVCYFGSQPKRPEPFSGLVLEIRDRIKISYFDPPEQKILWVDPEDIEKQSSSRCAHNAECGWCDDTGKCIYE
jgi:hypothetical protein